jgi:AhpD family alkylhydroperoxidase
LEEREAVQLTAAHVHGCDFCLAGHGAVMLKKAGEPREKVKQLQIGALTGNVRIDAITTFTKNVIASRGAVSDQDYLAFAAHGFGPQQALEIVLGVSLATLCNFANNLAVTKINPQLTPYLPTTI